MLWTPYNFNTRLVEYFGKNRIEPIVTYTSVVCIACLMYSLVCIAYRTLHILMQNMNALIGRAFDRQVSLVRQLMCHCRAVVCRCSCQKRCVLCSYYSTLAWLVFSKLMLILLTFMFLFRTHETTLPVTFRWASQYPVAMISVITQKEFLRVSNLLFVSMLCCDCHLRAFSAAMVTFRHALVWLSPGQMEACCSVIATWEHSHSLVQLSPGG